MWFIHFVKARIEFINMMMFSSLVPIISIYASADEWIEAKEHACCYLLATYMYQRERDSEPLFILVCYQIQRERTRVLRVDRQASKATPPLNLCMRFLPRRTVPALQSWELNWPPIFDLSQPASARLPNSTGDTRGKLRLAWLKLTLELLLCVGSGSVGRERPETPR